MTPWPPKYALGATAKLPPLLSRIFGG